MSDELRGIIAIAHCGISQPCAWHRETAARSLAALKASGYEVVRLPEPLEREDGDEFTDFPGAFPYTPVVFDQHPGEVQIRAGAWCDEPLSATEARELGASILAAANAANAVDGAR